MLIKEFMTTNPITLDEDCSVTAAADIMKEKNIRRFPVLRNGKIIGIVTDRDLRSAAPSQVISFDTYERKLMPELHEFLSKIKIKDIMSRSVITVTPEQTIVAAAMIMLNQRISGMPVVDGQGKLLGIITEGDIFKALVDFSGARMGNTLFGFRLEDSPGSIKQVADTIREHGGRLASILTYYPPMDPNFRRVCIRIRDLPPRKLEAMHKALQQSFEVLYMIQDAASDA